MDNETPSRSAARDEFYTNFYPHQNLMLVCLNNCRELEIPQPADNMTHIQAGHQTVGLRPVSELIFE